MRKSIRINWATPLFLCLIYLGVNCISSIIVAVIAEVISSKEIIYYAIELQAIIGKIDLLITLFIIYRFIIPFDTRIFSFKLNPKETLFSITIAFVIFLVDMLIFSILPEKPARISYSNDYIKILNLVGLFVMAPILEEFFYRGLLFHKLATRYSFIFSAIFSSLLFSLFHLSWINLLPTFFLALACCYVLKKTGNIIYCIGIHAIVSISLMLTFHL